MRTTLIQQVRQLTKLSKLTQSFNTIRQFGSSSDSIKTGCSVGYNRIQDFYYDVIQEDLLAMKFQYPGAEYDLKQMEIPEKVKFNGPQLDESGKKIQKKGSIRPKRPSDVMVSPVSIPELETIHVQLMMTEAIGSKYALLSGYLLLEAITGQPAKLIEAKSNVAGWKLRKGAPVGCQVTLTGGKMYAFLDKLVEVVLPRIKEYDGFQLDAGDGTGNLAMGFPPSSVGLFPDVEIIYDMIPNVSGFNIVFNTNSPRNPNARLLMSALQLPFVPRVLPRKN